MICRTHLISSRPFKEHIVIDLAGPWESKIIRHHRRKCRRAFESVEVLRCETPQDYLDAWVQLYEHLVVTHEIEGMRTFSRRSLSQQLDVPGASLFVAIHDGRVVAALTTYQRDDVAYAHLTAADKIGYELGASYAIHLVAIRYYVGKVRWFNLTGVPGLSDAGGAGAALVQTGLVQGDTASVLLRAHSRS